MPHRDALVVKLLFPCLLPIGVFEQITDLMTGSAGSIVDTKMVHAVTTAVAALGRDKLRQK
jgi:hypothetical protein